MKEYKGIIDKVIRDNYQEILVIDIFQDKIYKYKYVDDNFKMIEELSYMDYLNRCKNFIYEDDLDKYVDALAISRLENGEGKTSVSYRMLDEAGGYQEYINDIALYQ